MLRTIRRIELFECSVTETSKRTSRCRPGGRARNRLGKMRHALGTGRGRGKTASGWDDSKYGGLGLTLNGQFGVKPTQSPIVRIGLQGAVAALTYAKELPLDEHDAGIPADPTFFLAVAIGPWSIVLILAPSCCRAQPGPPEKCRPR